MTNKPRLAMTGKGKGCGKGFEITSELDKPAPPDPRPAPHLIHNVTGVPACSECGHPVQAPPRACTVCTGCGQQYGTGCGA
jgi:hypothetical protein